MKTMTLMKKTACVCLLTVPTVLAASTNAPVKLLFTIPAASVSKLWTAMQDYRPSPLTNAAVTGGIFLVTTNGDVRVFVQAIPEK